LIIGDPDLTGELELVVDDFHLRPLQAADAPDLFTHFADPRVVAFMDIDPFTDFDEARAVIDWAMGQRALRAGVRWAIRDSAGAFVGTCGFNRLVVERGRRGEVAYDLGHAWWRRGVMAAILPALIAFGLGRLELHRLDALVTPGNHRSCRLLERHGFAREGVLKGYGYWKGRYWDQIVYARIAPHDPGS
jgi:ribosomal-protein-alanine N-acetyltransferase